VKDTAIGVLGLSCEEFYSMTLGNFVRRSLGHTRNTWVTQREVIAAIMGQWTQDKLTGETVFPFGLEKAKPDPPTEQDREYMRKRHENTLKLLNG
jgi:hypothetical protein